MRVELLKCNNKIQGWKQNSVIESMSTMCEDLASIHNIKETMACPQDRKRNKICSMSSCSLNVYYVPSTLSLRQSSLQSLQCSCEDGELGGLAYEGIIPLCVHCCSREAGTWLVYFGMRGPCIGLERWLAPAQTQSQGSRAKARRCGTVWFS